MNTVWDLPRNDLAACEAYHEAHGATPDDVRVMLKLQDDPTELMRIVATWETHRG